ncbi:MAG: TonB-dependent receptor [Chitinophagales bacterium]
MRRILTLAIIVLVAVQAYAQGRTISGNITDAVTDEAIIGCTVILEGTQTGSISDIDGHYEISLPGQEGTLIFSFVGYVTQSVTVGISSNIDVLLEPSAEVLEEVVVVGYGTEIKTKLTGSISEVGGEDIALTPVSTLEQTLQGKAAGLFIESNNGKVGSDVRIRIRGSSSVNASNQPLIVVDGVPINTVAVNDYYNVKLNPLNDIDFNDIESVEVLKDASASAIYGSRAANGVILITTKHGEAGKNKITVDYQQGFSQPSRLRDFMSATQYVNYYREAAINAGVYDYANGISGYATEEEAINDYIDDLEKKFDKLDGYSDWRLGGINTDWQSLAFQKAVSSMIDLSASGGTDKFQYFTSMGYSYQDGIMINNHGDRFNITSNLDAKLTEKLSVGLNINMSRSINNDIPDDNAFSTPLQMVAQAPITPPIDTATGEYYDRPTTLYYNPLIETENTFFESTTFRTIGNVNVEYKILPVLRARVEVGGDITNHYQSRYYGSKSEVGLSVGGYASNYFAGVQYFDTKGLLIYDKSWADAHNVEITGGAEYNDYDDHYNFVEGQGFPNDKLQTIASAAEIVYGTGVVNAYRFISYFGRANYDYKSTWLLSLTGRADGSSRFGENNRYGFFPSISAGYVISNADYMADSKISFLKLRISYGYTGNAEIGNYEYKGLYGVGSYDDASALYPSTVSNPDLTWEKTAQLDVGLDWGLFKDRLNGEIDYYNKQTTDLLLAVPVPSTTGYTVQTQNVGALQNVGFEFLINADILTGKFKWSSSLNYSLNRNKVTELADGQTIIDYGGSDFMNVVMVGQPLGVFYGAEFAGADPENGDGLWYVNGPGTGEETTNDFNAANYVVIGDPNPDFIAGMTNHFSYKNFALDVSFQGVYGNDVNLQGDYWMAANASQYDNETVDQLDAWSSPGDQTDIPEPRLLFANGTASRSSRYLSDGSYVRLKTATLSYNLPKALMAKWGMGSIRVYASGYNLYTLTKYRGWDPEVSSDSFVDNVYYGIDFYSAPQPRTIVFGVSMEF